MIDSSTAAVFDRNATAFPHRDPADDETLASLDAWWRTANYLAVGQIYLLDNPLLRQPLTQANTWAATTGGDNES